MLCGVSSVKWKMMKHYVVQQTQYWNNSFVFSLCFRYQFFLQVKQDILQGRLPCPVNTAAQLGAYVIQCKFLWTTASFSLLSLYYDSFKCYLRTSLTCLAPISEQNKANAIDFSYRTVKRETFWTDYVEIIWKLTQKETGKPVCWLCQTVFTLLRDTLFCTFNLMTLHIAYGVCEKHVFFCGVFFLLNHKAYRFDGVLAASSHKVCQIKESFKITLCQYEYASAWREDMFWPKLENFNLPVIFLHSVDVISSAFDGTNSHLERSCLSTSQLFLSHCNSSSLFKYSQ